MKRPPTPPDRKVDEEALKAAKDFLLGRTGNEPRARDRRGAAPASTTIPSPAPPAEPEPARLELSAPDVSRVAGGWRARCIHKRGVDSRHVNDARYGGYIGSFIEAIEVRDRFYRERGMQIPWRVEAVVDGERVAPEVRREKRSTVVSWQGEEHVVTGNDADEIATEIALDLFVEFLGTLQARAASEEEALRQSSADLFSL